MKKAWILSALLLACALCAALPRPAAAGEPARRKLTVMVYMCGSNLESLSGSATGDLMEMTRAGIGSDVSVLVMTGGARRWAWDLSLSGRTAIHEIDGSRPRELWSSDVLNMGDGETLTRLLEFGRENRPADGYALILWDHGAGPLEGICWDELFSMDRLSLSELTAAIADADLPGKLRWIGFDACLMADAEVAAALSPYADYMIASQETEPSTGWNYAFLAGLSGDEDGAETGRRIVDSYFDGLSGSRDLLTLSCVDLSRMDALVDAIDRFFDPLSAAVDESSFPDLSGSRMAAGGFGQTVRSAAEEGYDLVDLKGLAGEVGRDCTELLAALDDAVVFSRSTGDTACGLSVYHPYYNKDRYLGGWNRNYQRLRFSPGYLKYVRSFGDLLTGEPMTDWSGLETSDDGFDADGNHLFSLRLTESQRQHLASAELYILEESFPDSGPLTLVPVSVSPASAGDGGVLSGVYRNRGLYVLDAEDRVLAGPLSYELSRKGPSVYVRTVYRNYSGRNPEIDTRPVIQEFETSPDSPDLTLLRRYVYDRATQSYTNRIAFTEEGMTDVEFHHSLRNMPEDTAELPGFDSWEPFNGYTGYSISLREAWHLRFEEHMGSDLYAMFQLTDVNQNVWSSRPVRIRNPLETEIPVSPAELTAGDTVYRFSLIRDLSDVDPMLKLRVEAENRSGEKLYIVGTPYILNGTRSLADYCYLGDLQPGEAGACTDSFTPEALAGLASVSSVDFTLKVSAGSPRRETAVPVRLDVGPGSLDGLAQPLPQPLAEGAAGGFSVQLLSLGQEPDGSFRIGLLARNDGSEDFTGDLYTFVNRVAVGYDYNGNIPAGTERLFSLSPENQEEMTLFDFIISGSRNMTYAAVRQAAEQAGVRAADEIDFYFGMNFISGAEGCRVHLDLPQPLPLREPEPLPCDPVPLLAGDVSAAMEFMMLGDNGLGLGLRLRNDTDRTVILEMVRPTVNGTEYYGFGSGDRLVLPARSRAVCCLSWQDRDISMGTPAETLQFAFLIGKTESTPVLLSFPEGTVFGAPFGTLLNADRITVQPARFDRKLP